MHRSNILLAVLALVLLAALAISAGAQDMASPQVMVRDQLVLNNAVDIDGIYSQTPAYVVIHRTSDGEVVGVSSPLAAGWNYNVRIALDPSKAEAQMSAMLHTDDNIIGTYEFGTVEGADGPVKVGDQIVNPIFNAQVLSATDQLVENNQVTIRAVAVPVDSWVVVHAGDAANFGAVLGQTLVKAGTAGDVSVDLAADGRTEILWPMLHVDSGAMGTYEFGMVEGADGPVVMDGQVATFPIWTTPHIRVADQAVLHGDNAPDMGGDMMQPTLKVTSALLAEPGFVVIHQEKDGSFGPVAGVSDPLPAGLSTNLQIALDSTLLTPRLWPMLHVDSGTAGVYEFGAVEGADGPVVDSAGNVVTFAIDAAPSLTVMDGPLTTAMGMDNTLHIENAVMDAPGWIAVHAAGPDGKPSGEVIATHLLHPGANWHIHIPVDPAKAGSLVFPMLHYDTGEIGVYEFGTVEGADAPVLVGGAPVVPPLNITMQ